MTQLDQGFNRIRDLHYDDMDTGFMGTDGTAVVSTQTGLQVAVSASEVTLTKTKSDKSVTTEYKLDAGTATGNTFREYITANGTDLAFNRYVFTGIEHTSADEIVVKNVWFYGTN